MSRMRTAGGPRRIRANQAKSRYRAGWTTKHTSDTKMKTARRQSRADPSKSDQIRPDPLAGARSYGAGERRWVGRRRRECAGVSWAAGSGDPALRRNKLLLRARDAELDGACEGSAGVGFGAAGG